MLTDEVLSPDDFKNAKRDIDDIGKSVNQEVVVNPRWGASFKSLPLVSKEWQAKLTQFNINAEKSLSDFQDAINIASAAGAGANGWTDLLVKTWSGNTQSEKNKENISPFDFMAKGDGVADDTQAFVNLEAMYQGRTIDLLGKTYLVNEVSTKNDYINGSFKVGSDLIQVKDKFKSPHLSVNLKGQLNDKSSSLMWSWFLTTTWVAGADANACQNIAFDEKNRVIYGFYESSVYSGSSVLYRIPMDVGMDFNAPIWAADGDTRIGHQGLGLENNSDGATYLWTSKRNNATNSVDPQAGCKVIRFRADNVPTYSTAGGASNEWSGRNGLYFENVQEFQLFPLQNTEQNTNVTLSYDQKYLIAKMSAGANYKIRVFLLDTLVNGGSGDYSKKYINEFLVPLSGAKGITMQDMCSDGQHLYLYGGRSTIANGATLAVQVYDLIGNYVDGFTASDLGLNDSINYVRPDVSSVATISETESINFVTINGKPQLTIHIASGNGGSRPNLVFVVCGAYGNFRGNGYHPAITVGHTQQTGGVDIASQRRKSLRLGMVSDDGKQTQNIVVKASKIVLGNGEDYDGNLQLESIQPLGIPNAQVQGTFAIMRRNASSTAGSRISLARSRNPNQFGSTALLAGDEVGGIWFNADDGEQDYTNSGGLSAATITANVVGTPTAGNVAVSLNFSTRTTDGTFAQRWGISSTGEFIPATSGSNDFGMSTRRIKKGWFQNISLSSLPIYTDNAAATTGGLVAGDVYRTSTGVLMVRY